MNFKEKLIHRIDEAICEPSHKSCRKILLEIRSDIINAKSERQLLRSATKLIELLGVLAKSYFESS